MSNDLHNVLDVDWCRWESIHIHYEAIVHGNKEKSKKLNQFRENIEPSPHKFLKPKNISQLIFSTKVVCEVTVIYLMEREVYIL